jgi:hypothetical protein
MSLAMLSFFSDTGSEIATHEELDLPGGRYRDWMRPGNTARLAKRHKLVFEEDA